MAWPTPQDYNEAIQNPQINFADPELKTGEPERTSLGLPRPISGSFASVYHMRCAKREYAVRCFLREYTDQQKRYAAISQHLANIRLPYMVEFKYLSEEIKVGNRRYPILKMEWIQGETLTDYVQRNLNDASTLFALANEWVTMIGALQRHGIAHGDLQHGNILVSNGNLKLIDYDGMYVPGLAGQGSHEDGHRNYQHPNRTAFDFGPYTDNFSAWVIYVSLLAFSAEPALWGRSGAGDESLLFRREDFERPDASPILTQLVTHRDGRVSAVAGVFQSLLSLMPRDVPALNGQSATPPSVSSAPVGEKWWEDAQTEDSKRHKPIPQDDTLPPDRTYEPPSVDWIVENLGKEILPAVQPFALPLLIPRLSVALILLIFLLVALLIPHFAPLLILVGISIAILAGNVTLSWFYAKEPSVVSMRSVQEHERSAAQTLATLQQSNQEVETKKKRARDAEATLRRKLQRDRTELERKQQQEHNAVQTKLKSAMANVNTRRQNLNQQETKALNQAQSTIGARVAAFNRQLSSIDQSLADELRRALTTTQNNYVQNYLKRVLISDASITGIGPTYKSRLQRYGFYSAADVNYYNVQRVDGIGTARANALHSWRIGIENIARSLMPSQLPSSEDNRIRANYQQQKVNLTAQRDNEQRHLAAEENAIRANYRTMRSQLDGEQGTLQTKATQEAKGITDRYKSQYAAFDQTRTKSESDTLASLKALDERIAQIRKEVFAANWELTKVRHELEPYQTVTMRRYIRRMLFLSE